MPRMQLAAMDISSEGSSSYVGLPPRWYSGIEVETTIRIEVTMELNLITGMVGRGSISTEGSFGDIGSISMSGNGDIGKSQGASSYAGGASGITVGTGGMPGSSTPCMQLR